MVLKMILRMFLVLEFIKFIKFLKFIKFIKFIKFLKLKVFNDEGDCMAPGDGFADALGQRLEGLEGVLEASGDDASAEDDAAVGPVMHPVAGLEHGALSRHVRVVENKFQLLAAFTTCCEL